MEFSETMDMSKLNPRTCHKSKLKKWWTSCPWCSQRIATHGLCKPHRFSTLTLDWQVLVLQQGCLELYYTSITIYNIKEYSEFGRKTVWSIQEKSRYVWYQDIKYWTSPPRRSVILIKGWKVINKIQEQDTQCKVSSSQGGIAQRMLVQSSRHVLNSCIPGSVPNFGNTEMKSTNEVPTLVLEWNRVWVNISIIDQARDNKYNSNNEIPGFVTP